MSSSRAITTVYGPSLLLVVGAAILKKELVPFAVVIAAAASGYQLLSGGGAAKPASAASSNSNADAKSTGGSKGVLDPSTFQNYPITQKNEISHNTAIYRFSLPSPDSILGLPIGQHISLAATLDVKDPKTGEVTNKEVVRSYTPISSDTEPGFFDLLIKSYPTGNISRHLATLNVGDTMKVRGPKGAMVYTPNMCREIGMIAGGTGITPMLQIVKAVLRGRSSGDKTKLSLIFANVDEKDILLRDQLEKLSKEDDNFNVYYVLNNAPEGWKGGVGFVTADMIKEHLPAPASDIKILLCGPPPMVSAMKKATESLGYEKARPVSKLEDQVFSF